MVATQRQDTTRKEQFIDPTDNWFVWRFKCLKWLLTRISGHYILSPIKPKDGATMASTKLNCYLSIRYPKSQTKT